jgi:hypothetical protein
MPFFLDPEARYKPYRVFTMFVEKLFIITPTRVTPLSGAPLKGRLLVSLSLAGLFSLV